MKNNLYGKDYRTLRPVKERNTYNHYSCLDGSWVSVGLSRDDMQFPERNVAIMDVFTEGFLNLKPGDKIPVCELRELPLTWLKGKAVYLKDRLTLSNYFDDDVTVVIEEYDHRYRDFTCLDIRDIETNPTNYIFGILEHNLKWIRSERPVVTESKESLNVELKKLLLQKHAMELDLNKVLDKLDVLTAH